MSCRRGTPRNDCGCCKSLAEKVRELYQRCANAIKSINGINPDGANNFDILPGAGIQVNPRANGIEIVATGAAPQDVVKSVNGTTPDADGDVQINTGLLTVNTIAPDADGEFTISAGSGIQINAATNGIEIENISQGAIYTGVSPIQINADNEISLADFAQVTDTNWAKYAVGWPFVVQKDIIVAIGTANNRALVFIPRGFTFQNDCINIVWNPQDWSYTISDSIWLRDIFKDGNNYTASSDTQRRKTGSTNNTGYVTLSLAHKISSPKISKYTGNISISFQENVINIQLWVRQ